VWPFPLPVAHHSAALDSGVVQRCNRAEHGVGRVSHRRGAGLSAQTALQPAVRRRTEAGHPPAQVAYGSVPHGGRSLDDPCDVVQQEIRLLYHGAAQSALTAAVKDLWRHSWHGRWPAPAAAVLRNFSLWTQDSILPHLKYIKHIRKQSGETQSAPPNRGGYRSPNPGGSRGVLPFPAPLGILRQRSASCISAVDGTRRPWVAPRPFRLHAQPTTSCPRAGVV